MDITTIIRYCIKRAINPENTDTSIDIKALSEEDLNKFLMLSCANSIAPITAVGSEAAKNSDVHPVFKELRNQMLASVMMHEKRAVAIAGLCSVLENAETEYILLKGSVLYELYPEPWMRTFCDIDVLVKEEKLKTASEALESAGYRYVSKGSHDISFVSPEGITVELHFRLIETDQKVNGILKNMWNYIESVPGHAYQYKMTDEMFYFYHIAHMAKHFIFGGCGVRSFIDLYFLNKKCMRNNDETTRLLKRGGLYVFSEKASALSGVWLENHPHDEITENMEDFIISGGNFGSYNNRIKIEKTYKTSNSKFVLKRLFMPYDKMRLKYPVLEKYAVLLPLFWIKRWFEYVINPRKIKGSLIEVSISSNLKENEISETQFLLESLGLKQKI